MTDREALDQITQILGTSSGDIGAWIHAYYLIAKILAKTDRKV